MNDSLKILNALFKPLFELVVPPNPILALFPKEQKEWWYCGQWYMYRSEEKDAGRPYREKDGMPKPPYLDRFMIDPFEPSGFGVVFERWESEYEIACLIKEYEGQQWVGLYSASHRYGRRSFYDGAPWDDGYKIDLTLTRVIPLEEFERLKPEGNACRVWPQDIASSVKSVL